MAGNQPARKDAGAFDINEWMAQRQADVQRLLHGAEAAGRELWVKSTKTGQNLLAQNPQELKALGAQYLDAQARAFGGKYARQLGNAAGVVRAGVHGVQGMHDDLVLAGRILNPLDRLSNPPGQKPLQPVISAANNIVDYAFNAPSHLGRVAEDAGKQIHKWNIELNPFATPQADTLGGELSRNFQIGMNQGEVGADAAALAFGSGALKVVPRLAPISEAAETAKFVKRGFSPEQAAHLAKPYVGMGHHFIPRRFAVPKNFAGIPMPDFLVGQKLPPWLSDSVFNVLRPTNISRGDFYELHYKVDPQFHGAKGWSGKALGLKRKRYGLLGQLWHGSPAPLNAASGVLGGVGFTNHENAEGDRS